MQETTEIYKTLEDHPIPVYRLMTEESSKSGVPDSTLLGGLCGIVTTSGWGEVVTYVTATQLQTLEEGIQPPEEVRSPVLWAPPLPCLSLWALPTLANSSPLLLQGCLTMEGDLERQLVIV
jgi:hypothetical protein